MKQSTIDILNINPRTSDELQDAINRFDAQLARKMERD